MKLAGRPPRVAKGHSEYIKKAKECSIVSFFVDPVKDELRLSPPGDQQQMSPLLAPSLYGKIKYTLQNNFKYL
jgi:hypothetical protein